MDVVLNFVCHFPISIRPKVGPNQPDGFICISNLRKHTRTFVRLLVTVRDVFVVEIRYLVAYKSKVWECFMRTEKTPDPGVHGRPRSSIISGDNRGTTSARQPSCTAVARHNTATSGCTQPRINRIVLIRFSWSHTFANYNQTICIYAVRIEQCMEGEKNLS